MRILITNDDGIFSEGLRELAEAMATHGEVVVVAPDREQSASGHSLTLNRPLRLQKVREHWYAVDGTPTDCVNMAVHGLLKEAPPDLVVSGINFGVNMGDDVTYSGTVSAAFEASLHHLPAVAFSQQIAEGFSFARAATGAREIVGALLASELPRDLLLNVNFPALEHKGLRWTKLGKRYYEQNDRRKGRPHGPQVLLDLRHAEMGARGRRHRPRGGFDRLRVGHPAAPRPHRLPGPRRGSAAARPPGAPRIAPPAGLNPPR